MRFFFAPERNGDEVAGGIFFGGKMRLSAMALGVLRCLHGVGKYRRSAARRSAEQRALSPGENPFSLWAPFIAILTTENR